VITVEWRAMGDVARGGRAARSSASKTAAVSLGEARTIVKRVLGSLPVRVFLFGSRALGTSRPSSDIDIAILPDGPVPDDLVARLRDALEESAIPYPVDVVDLSRVDAGFRERVLRDGEPWDV
jgi:predicted nucleotidyltransferase